MSPQRAAGVVRRLPLRRPRPKRLEPEPTVPRLFVTATDTGVGKTVVASALLSLLAEAGYQPAPFKPYESGCERLSAPSDALSLKQAARSLDPLEQICPHRFRAPLAPGVAARRLGKEPDFRRTLAAFRGFQRRALIVEGAGGLRVPLDGKRDVVDLIRALRLPVVLVARAGLGTLNHTALSLECLERRGLPVRAVVLSQAVAEIDPSVRDNGALLEERHGVKVLGPIRHHPDPVKLMTEAKQVVRPLLRPWL